MTVETSSSGLGGFCGVAAGVFASGTPDIVLAHSLPSFTVKYYQRSTASPLTFKLPTTLMTLTTDGCGTVMVGDADGDGTLKWLSFEKRSS